MQRSVKERESKTLDEFYKTLKPTLQLLCKLASNGLLSQGDRGIHSLVFDEDNFSQLRAGPHEGKQSL